jgi:hypothetical protein
MTFTEAVARYTPYWPHMALIETWTSGGSITGGLVVSHSKDLPPVYGFIHKLHPSYVGPLEAGNMISFPRYQYETIHEGFDVDYGNWSLAIMDIGEIDTVIPLEDILL